MDESSRPKKSKISESDVTVTSLSDVVDAQKLEKVETLIRQTKTALNSKKSTKKSLASTSEKLLTVIEDFKVRFNNIFFINKLVYTGALE